ncbi:MAG TPA: class I SAM-dependent methyltransferase [Candidatus Binatia bacterium]|jgi:SAM-dependent methyltransferase
MYQDAYEELIARTYDAVYARVRDPSGDRTFYLELAREVGGPVLELGCGTGRTLIPIARAGIECMGLDTSPAMLRVLREKSPDVHVVNGDMRDFDLGRRFRLVTIPFRALSHLLDVDAQLACFACVRRHLEKDGALAFDVFDPNLAIIAKAEIPESLSVTFDDGGRPMRPFESTRFDRAHQVLTVTFRFEGGPPELTGAAEIRLRWFYRYELEHLLARAGFTDVRLFGAFDRRPWGTGDETVVIAR